MKPNKLTHTQLAKALGVSRSYVSRLVRLGMPTDSVKSAEAWIEQRSKELGTDHGSQQTLTDARREKIRLECEILTLRLERERDDVELVSIGEIEKFIRSFIAFAAVAFRAQSETLTNELTGLPEIEVCSLLRQAFNRTLFCGIVGYLRGSAALDQRLVTHGEDCLNEQFSHFPAFVKADLEREIMLLFRRVTEQ